MAIDQESFNKKLYDLLKTKGYNPVPKDSKNKRTENPQEADVFNFTFTKKGEELGTAWVSIDDAQNVILYYDDSLMDTGGRSENSEFDDSWTGFIQQLKRWAMGKQLGFELRDRNKLGDDMAQREFTRKKENISEGYYPMGKQSSYNDNVPTVKIILQHTRQIQEGEQRFRNIARIYLENNQGERLLAPTIRPGIAQVYARHLAEGGLPNDERWNHIKNLCEEYNKMAGFVRATRNKQFNESAQSLINEGVNHYHNLRETLGRMRSNRGYHKYFESFTPVLNEESTDNVSLNELFVQETLDPRIESVLPILNKLHKKLDEMKETIELEEWAQNISELKEPNKITMQQYLDARKKIQQVQMLLHNEPNPAKKEQMKKLLAKKLATLQLSAEQSGLEVNEGINVGHEKIIKDKIYNLENQLKDPKLTSDQKQDIEVQLEINRDKLNQLNKPQTVSASPRSNDLISKAKSAADTSYKKQQDAKFRNADAGFDILGAALGVREGLEEGMSNSEEYADQIIDSIGYEGISGNIDGNKIYRAVEEYQKMMDNPEDLDVDEVVEIIVDRLDIRHLGEDLGPEQKAVGQLGPTEKVKNNNIGKLVGASESVENPTMNEDSDEARELELFATNDSDLYRQSYLPIVKNLERKFKKGIYDKELAKKLWVLHAARAAKKYGQEHSNDDGLKIFSTAVRREVAEKLRDDHFAEMEAGNFHDVVNELSPETRKNYLMKAAPLNRANPTANRSKGINRALLGPTNVQEEKEETEKKKQDDDLPFSGGKPAKGTVVDKSGAKHSPMSRAKDLAQKGKDSVKEEGLAEGLNEMDKSQPSSDRGGESSGNPYAKGVKATPVKAKDIAKDAEKELEKSYKKGVKEGQEDLDRILKLSGK